MRRMTQLDKRRRMRQIRGKEGKKTKLRGRAPSARDKVYIKLIKSIPSKERWKFQRILEIGPKFDFWQNYMVYFPQANYTGVTGKVYKERYKKTFARHDRLAGEKGLSERELIQHQWDQAGPKRKKRDYQLIEVEDASKELPRNLKEADVSISIYGANIEQYGDFVGTVNNMVKKTRDGGYIILAPTYRSKLETGADIAILREFGVKNIKKVPLDEMRYGLVGIVKKKKKSKKL